MGLTSAGKAEKEILPGRWSAPLPEARFRARPTSLSSEFSHHNQGFLFCPNPISQAR